MPRHPNILATAGQRAERSLLEEDGVDTLAPGGFARRDEIRQSVSEQAQQERRLKRAANLAYRDALRRGDRQQAFQIALQARKEGIQFGGIQAAGLEQQKASQVVGEELRTRRAEEAQSRAEQEAGERRTTALPSQPAAPSPADIMSGRLQPINQQVRRAAPAATERSARPAVRAAEPTTGRPVRSLVSRLFSKLPF